MGNLARLTAPTLLILSMAGTASADFILHPKPGTGNWTLVPNGAFETGDLTNWRNAIHWQGDFEVSSETAFQGSYSTKGVPAGDFSGPGFALVTDPIISVIPNETYVLSAFFNASGLSEGNLYVDMGGRSWERNVGLLYHYPIAPTLRSSGWFFAWEEFTVPSDETQTGIRVVIDHEASLGEYGYADEIAVTLASDFSPPVAIPEPSALALLAFGLAAVLAARGRKRK